MDVSKSPDITRKFTKAYFSNADVNLKCFHRIFERDALIYVTLSSFSLPENPAEVMKAYSAKFKCDIGKFYDVDVKRTRESCFLEYTVNPYFFDRENEKSYSMDWTPCVLRRK
jgi:hypothetical protein